MGKKKATSGLGRALIKDRAQSQRGLRGRDSWLHTSELNDGYDWGRLNLQSVTEQSSLDDFLATAELAGTEFVAEKLNIKFVPAEARTGLLTSEESSRINKLHEENKQFLCIPRRPHWDKSTSAEALKQSERENFLEWRRQLAKLEEEKKLILTPFERNLDFWRQLWRVIERSDVVVQIVDARNPLLFRCQDLERYVKEVNPQKENIILINKADLLAESQRQAWAAYFEKEGVKVVFWSALAEAQRLSEDAGQSGDGQADVQNDSITTDEEDSENDEDLSETEAAPTGDLETSDTSDEYEDCEDDEGWQTCSEDAEDEEERVIPEHESERTEQKVVSNESHLVQSDELLEVFKSIHTGKRVKAEQITIGLVGYPNVGKSSTINTILGHKKVSVSATPGHTKHFQTLYVEAGLCLCDCPGLVMPSFVSTKAEMICSGILPIDQMRDHVPPISLIAQRIPRDVMEAIYSVNIIRPREDEDQDRSPTSEELLTAYGYMRGFMTAHGQPDQPRSARYILKDYVNGKLLYCHPPPGIDPAEFQPCHSMYSEKMLLDGKADAKGHGGKKVRHIENVVDKTFFHQENVRALTKGVQSVVGYKPGSGPMPLTTTSTETLSGKPWKKHGNKNKKEKVRRLYKHLDA
ncbi:large subunit GTPase 1 homolog [Hyla sarda]|uniref:large subunit GTPase 1 homolog n=1 Tax=Hyla sarda TaxID=327740 RepID=UPI0024C3A88D|nr:large subunit GTPase 1 homolog [Hyla sarda]